MGDLSIAHLSTMWQVMTSKIIFLTIILLLIILIVIRRYFVVVTVEHESMSPVLHAGDRVLVIRYWPVKLLKKGDIVLVWPWISMIRLDSAPRPFGVLPYIKRIIGLPGDTITTRLDELDDYHKRKLSHTYDNDGKKAFIIPDDHFFVRGDFPIGGIDSRTFGPVHKQGILGLVIMKLSLARPLD